MFSRTARTHSGHRPIHTQVLLRRDSLAALTCSGPVSATEPTRTTEISNRRDDPFLSCPGSDIIGQLDITREIATYSDKTLSP